MNNLFLRTCNADGTSHGGFKWNLEIGGITEAPDWNPEPKCGGGLHGLLHGKGGCYVNRDQDALWMVCEALGPIVDLHSKIKTSKAKTLFVGSRKDATDFLIACGCNASEMVGAFIVGGNGVYLHATYLSTVTTGHASNVTGRDHSNVTAGDYSTVIGGDYSDVTGGDYSTVTGGSRSIVSGGNGSILSLEWFDGKRTRISIAYVGEDGIEPDVPYKLDENGKFVRA